jgi:glucokinase
MTVDMTIYHGTPPGEAEFGHLWLDREGANVESRCSGWTVDLRIRSAIQEDRNGVLARLAGSQTGCEARHLAAALLQHDPIAKRILDDLAGDLGFVLSHVAHLLHPAVIILGGGLSLVGEPLRNAVTKAMAGRIMTALSGGPRIALAELGEDAVPTGALILASQRTQDAEG